MAFRNRVLAATATVAAAGAILAGGPAGTASATSAMGAQNISTLMTVCTKDTIRNFNTCTPFQRSVLLSPGQSKTFVVEGLSNPSAPKGGMKGIVSWEVSMDAVGNARVRYRDDSFFTLLFDSPGNKTVGDTVVPASALTNVTLPTSGAAVFRQAAVTDTTLFSGSRTDFTLSARIGL
ncbi:hypothetical protein FXF51_33015 [Nonomuraea sp. PA05]|uniref:hypothetical protein n=1 Tax=Nonomuraea sp. PA05 TaxID=2604466 RepID=UPI0011DC3868|nr:hypothetical protein [Nonomuraea sp. PA05]TYB59834.1 hypothetical protein FXF51_33015 [Nonomuraea sp. PA05]